MISCYLFLHCSVSYVMAHLLSKRMHTHIEGGVGGETNQEIKLCFGLRMLRAVSKYGGNGSEMSCCGFSLTPHLPGAVQVSSHNLQVSSTESK